MRATPHRAPRTATEPSLTPSDHGGGRRAPRNLRTRPAVKGAAQHLRLSPETGVLLDGAPESFEPPPHIAGDGVGGDRRALMAEPRHRREQRLLPQLAVPG